MFESNKKETGIMQKTCTGRFRWLFCLILTGILFLTACGKQETQNTPEEAPPPEPAWKTAAFAVNGQVEEEQGLWVEEYIPIVHGEVSSAGGINSWVRELGIYNMSAYRLHSCTDDSGEISTWYLEQCDIGTGESSLTELSPENIGIDDMANSYLQNACVTADGTLVLQIVSLGSKDGDLFYVTNEMLYTRLDGTLLQTVDVLPVYREKELLGEGYFLNPGDCICDGAGNLYARRVEGELPYQSLCVLDQEGNLVLEETLKEREQFGPPIRTAEGELLFPVSGPENNRVIWFDLQEKKAVTLAELERGQIYRLYGMQGNDLYYGVPEGIVRWDIVSGERKLVFKLKENGVDKMLDTALAFRENGAPVLRMWGVIEEEEEDWLLALTPERIERADTVRIVSLASETAGRVQATAARVARKNPDCNFVYANRGNRDAEDYRTQIMAEIMAGKGPDILYVSLEDMKLLQQNDALMDLRTLLTEDTLDQVLPGVLELGTVSDTLVGIAPEVVVESLMTSDDVWPGDTWTVDDVLGLMETGDYTSMFIQVSSAYYPRAVLGIMTKFNLENSFLIDRENGKCHFEDERFLKILEYALQYGKKDGDGEVSLGIGGAIATTDGAFDSLTNLLNARSIYGQDIHYVGYPTEKGNGNYLSCDGVVVVNRGADPETAKIYLECLLSERMQNFQADFGKRLSVRKVSLEDIQDLSPQEAAAYGEDVGAIWQGYPLQVREDGTTVLHDYKAFLENCVPAPATNVLLENIVWEEAEAFLEGDKPAREVARIINSRVQMYLDENR